MALPDRLKQADGEVQDTFAAARAAIDGYKVTGEMTEEGLEVIREMFTLRDVLGWADDDEV